MSFILVLLISTATWAYAADNFKKRIDSMKRMRDFPAPSVCENKVEPVTNKTKTIVERLSPGDELQTALKRIATEHKLRAGVIVSAVGSLSCASLRFAGAHESTTIDGPLEVVSATGTISETSMHVHLSASDSSGKTVGGHMMPGCKVYTTIELVILDLSDEWVFDRKTDEGTTYLELDARRVAVE